MVDISDDTKPARRAVEVTGVVRRRRWTVEEKGRIVAEAVAPGAVIAEVARRHDLMPQHMSNWIRAAKDGHFVLPADDPPVVEPAEASKPAPYRKQSGCIEIAIGTVMVRVPSGTDARAVEAVLRAVKRAGR